MFYTLMISIFLGLTPKPVNAVLIGEKVPNVLIRNILNYKSKSLTLSSLKGKLVIFDFGNTGCAPCIKLLPEMERLKKEFGDKIEIFFVIPEGKERATEFFKNNPRVKNLNVPVIYGDTILHQMFPHRFFPFESWVSAEGKLIARTESDYVTSKNIAKILKGDPIDFVMQFDRTYDAKKNLLKIDSSNIPESYNHGIKPKLFYSSVTNYLDGAPPTSQRTIDSTKGTVKFSIINTRLMTMFQMFWDPGLPQSQFLVDVKSPERLIQPKDAFRSAWIRQNGYCYESVLPISLSESERYARYRNDLETFFGYTAKKEIRNADCWVLRKAPEFADVWKRSIPTTEETKASADDNDLMTLDNIVGRMNWSVSGCLPTIDETGISKTEQQQVFLKDVLKNGGDFEWIRLHLKYYGIDLVKEPRTLERFVITDK